MNEPIAAVSRGLAGISTFYQAIDARVERDIGNTERFEECRGVIV